MVGYLDTWVVWKLAIPSIPSYWPFKKNKWNAGDWGWLWSLQQQVYAPILPTWSGSSQELRAVPVGERSSENPCQSGAEQWGNEEVSRRIGARAPEAEWCHLKNGLHELAQSLTGMRGPPVGGEPRTMGVPATGTPMTPTVPMASMPAPSMPAHQIWWLSLNFQVPKLDSHEKKRGCPKRLSVG